jgi:hypothetical protein
VHTFLRCDHFAEEVVHRLVHYERIRHYYIYVELQDKEEYLWVKVAKTLSDVRDLRHLRITLGGYEQSNIPPFEELYKYSHLLQPFALIRNVGLVDVSGGVRPRFAQYLKSVMEGGSPMDHLPKMYDALEYLAGLFNEYEDDLQRACDATENDDDDVEEFKRIRMELVQRVIDRTERTLNSLFDHGTEPHRHEEGIIDKGRRSIRRRRLL